MQTSFNHVEDAIEHVYSDIYLRNADAGGAFERYHPQTRPFRSRHSPAMIEAQLVFGTRTARVRIIFPQEFLFRPPSIWTVSACGRVPPGRFIHIFGEWSAAMRAVDKLLIYAHLWLSEHSGIWDEAEQDAMSQWLCASTDEPLSTDADTRVAGDVGCNVSD